LRISSQPPFEGRPTGQIRPAGHEKKKANPMKKKSLKSRLTLNRETLRNLNADQMSEAQGGIVLQPVSSDCPRLNTNVGCPSDTCPTRCGQWYCYAV
jgi:hypothetical protein